MNAGRPALAAASAGVTICRARKLKIVGIFCVRGGTAPKSQWLLSAEFSLLKGSA
jgi:hypothetical protein